MASKEPVEVVADEDDAQYSTKGNNTASKGAEAKRSNPNQNVGGTAKDGGVSTEATVMDGGPDEAEDDSTYKPS